MFVRAEGSGPPILLLHAFPLDGRMWSDQVRDLAGDHRVLVPDLPGFGKSPRPDGNPSLEDWALEVIALCKSEGFESALVAGCSMGGYVAFAILRAAPQFVAGLALVDTRAIVDSQDARRARYEMVEKARHEGTGFLQSVELPLGPHTLRARPDVVARTKVMLADATPVGVMTAQRAMASRQDSRALLATIRVPTAVVRGEDDPIVAHAEAESMANAIEGAKLVTVPDAGHLPPIECPEPVTDVLRAVAARTFVRR